MKKEVFVSLVGIQKDISADDAIEVTVPSELFERNGTKYIHFEQFDENQRQMCKNTLKIKDHTVELKKTGATNTRMHFEQDRNMMTYYDMPHGSMLLETRTNLVDILELEKEIQITLSYDLYMNEKFLSNCDVAIKVRER